MSNPIPVGLSGACQHDFLESAASLDLIAFTPDLYRLLPMSVVVPTYTTAVPDADRDFAAAMRPHFQRAIEASEQPEDQ